MCEEVIMRDCDLTNYIANEQQLSDDVFSLLDSLSLLFNLSQTKATEIVSFRSSSSSLLWKAK